MTRFVGEMQKLNRRSLLKLGVAAGAATLPHGMGLDQAFAADASPLTLPAVTVRWGALPSTNQAWVMLASKKGFLKDVGITMANGVPKIVQEPQAIAQVNNNELDVCGQYFGGIIQALGRVDNIRPFFCYSYFQGRAILCPPDAGIKTVSELMGQGLSWADATKQAIMQMKGQQFAIMNAPSVLPWIELALKQGDLTLADTQAIPLEDPRVVQLAIGGRVKFASPAGAVQIYQLQQQAGWKSLIDMPGMIKSMPNGEAALSDFLHYDLIMCTDEYLKSNRETIYRICGAMYRTLEYMFGPDRMTAYSEYAPFINAANGSSLDAQAIKYIFDVMDPFFRFSEQPKIWSDQKSPLYYKNIYEPQIKRMVASGALPDKLYDLDAMFASRSIFNDMLAMKQDTDKLLAKADGSLSGDKAALVQGARQHYEAYNFYDAQRLARLAMT